MINKSSGAVDNCIGSRDSRAYCCCLTDEANRDIWHIRKPVPIVVCQSQGHSHIHEAKQAFAQVPTSSSVYASLGTLCSQSLCTSSSYVHSGKDFPAALTLPGSRSEELDDLEMHNLLHSCFTQLGIR